jgi:chemotaxis protein methyltransferase CheR
MSQPSPPGVPARPGITADEFEAVRAYLYEQTGIALGDAKRDMVCSRLARRLRARGAGSHAGYLALVRADPGERQEFVNALTTNKTEFFREGHHFEYLAHAVVPRLRAAGRARVRVWCAAASTGEEPYTLAMTLAESCPAAAGWDVRILASDIDTAVLAAAERGVYDADRAAAVPAPLLHKYFRRGTGAHRGKIAAGPELRALLTFRQINLIADPWPFRAQFDVIFCRNVVIYFDRDTQRKLLARFAAHLSPDGFLFMGHSENVHWASDTFAPLGGTVYRLRGAGPVPALPKPAAAKAASAAPTPPEEHSIILGDVKATRGPAVIKTLLGSCVAACVWDPETGVGGMNHFSLPGTGDVGADARYGAYAMELLITALMKKGGDRSRFRAKVFGGGKVLNVDAESLNVGARNAEFVLQYLGAEGIPVDARCLGGEHGLLVRFHPHTGHAQAKPLPMREAKAVAAKEEQFERELRRKAEAPPADDGITLF